MRVTPEGMAYRGDSDPDDRVNTWAVPESVPLTLMFDCCVSRVRQLAAKNSTGC